jgi:uncharacterized protein
MMASSERVIRPFFAFIVSHPGIVLGFFLLCLMALGWQARHFAIDASAETLLLRDDPNYMLTELVDRRFAYQEFLLVAYQPGQQPVFSTETFGELRTISNKLRQLARVESIRSILNVPIFSEVDVKHLGQTDPATLTWEHQNYTFAQLQEAFAGHPLYEDLLINREQTATAIQVLFKSDPELDRVYGRIIALWQESAARDLTESERRELTQLRDQAAALERDLDQTRITEIETIRAMVAEHEGKAAIYLGGLHVLGYQLIRIIKNDLIVFGSAIAVMICLILLLLFKRGRWVLITAACCGCSVLLTMGLFGLLGLRTTVISSNFIALQLILTLALVIHLIVQYREYSAAHLDWSQAELVRNTLLRKAAPIFYAGITTSVGFASLLFSNIQPVIAFGWMMIIAMFFTIAVSLVLFPALQAMYGREQPVPRGRFSTFFLDLCARISQNHPWLLGFLSICLLAASVAGIFRLEVENSFINYFRERTRIHQELSFIDRELGGSTPLDLIYTIPAAARKQDLIMTAETVQTMQRIQHTLQQYEAVGDILSVVNITELARDVNQGKPLTEYELTALYWTMEPAMREELLASFFSPEHEQVRFGIRIQDTTEGLNRSELLADIRKDMAALGIPEEHYFLTNLFVLYQDILQRLFRSQILTLGLVYGVLTLAFLLIFRSLKVALIGISPNILSILAVLGTMGWLGIPLDLMTITIAAIAMGIAVDDTIHYIHRYREELGGGAGTQAVPRSHASVGHAILYTSLIIILGLSLLAFSDFVPSILFGLLAGLAMALALGANLLLLPALLNKWVGRR